jgi:4-hydroxy-3-methylbut-2-en-1-yl diphosphate reductase
LKHNTTCPFVEKVWNRSAQLGQKDYTVVIHGKASHEETRATFSHTAAGAPAVIIKDMAEAGASGPDHPRENCPRRFHELFGSRCTPGFDPAKDLATHRRGEPDHHAGHRNAGHCRPPEAGDDRRKHGEADLKAHFADTRDTLCYATNDNQDATNELLKVEADLALVVGGYNSSNTSHLVELLEQKFPTYFIKDEGEILSADEIQHFNYPEHKLETNELAARAESEGRQAR